jgi:glycerophosphoryl diester phosphodiesterase
VSGRLTRIGHKGADALVPGNTVESFTAAVEAGVDVIELDVLRPRSDFDEAGDWKTAAAGPAANPGGPLLIAHDWADARRRDPLTLEEGLDAFLVPPLDEVDIDFDLKVAGREDELVAALGARGLLGRAMFSTMEVASLHELGRLQPELRLGWTIPKIGRDWSRMPWAKPMVIAGLASLRARLPRLVRRRAPALGLTSIWAYHPVVTRRLAEACHACDLALNAWTVDDVPTMRRLAGLGVDGICTNDPLLFAEL